MGAVGTRSVYHAPRMAAGWKV